MESAVNPAAFSRLAGEGEVEWAAFLSYREQTTPRSHRRVAVRGVLQKPGDVAAWMAQWRWTERVRAYDAWLDLRVAEERAKALGSDLKAVTARQAQLLAACHDLVFAEVSKIVANAEMSDLPALKVSDLIRLMDITIRSDRLIRGEVTESVEVKAESYDLSKLSIDDLRALKELRSKMEKK